MDKSYWLIGLHTLFLGIVSGNVQGDMACLQENVVLRWDILRYSKIDYAYIKHGRELIVTIGPLLNIIIEVEYKSQVQINITEPLQIEMTIYNVTKATNGTYTCTIGKYGEQDLILEKELFVIDPDITLSLNTDYNDCKTLNCSSKYKVALLGPNKTKPKNDTCLFKEHNGMYSCCLVNQSMCSSTYCKYIDVNVDEHNDTYHSRNTEKTTASNDLDKQNIGVIVGSIVMTFTILILLAIIIGLIIITKHTTYKQKRNDQTEKTTPSNDLDKQNIGVIVVLIVMTVTILILLAIIIGLIITKRATYKRKRNDQTVSALQKELEDLIQQQRSN